MKNKNPISNGYWKILLRRFGFLTSFLMLCSFLFAAIGSANNHSDQIEDKKRSNGYYFIKDAYKRNDMKQFVDIVWKTFVTRNLDSKELEMFNISKKDIVLILIDLNKDAKPDILASVVSNDYFCGKSGRDCALTALISSPSGGYSQIESCVSVFWEEFPVQVLNSKSNGLRDILVNNKALLKFNGKQYCHEN